MARLDLPDVRRDEDEQPSRVYVMTEGIRRNEDDPTLNLPCIVVRHSDGRTEYGNDVAIAGPSRVRYTRSDPYDDGTRVFLETSAPVSVVPDRSALA